jgi:hypothetical protein
VVPPTGVTVLVALASRVLLPTIASTSQVSSLQPFGRKRT